MIMNILEQEDLIKGAPDDVLIQEAQVPSGNLPHFLIVSELQRRKQMRDRVVAQQEQPEQTVSEQIVTEASAPQGIAGLAYEMPSQAASMSMSQQTIPQEMMDATEAPIDSQTLKVAGGGRMPYRRMAGGGIVPPNSLVEDAAKFNPQTMYDMDASQMAMASPTNMGIASVLPMAAGGVVRMQQGGYAGFAPYVSAKDAAKDAAFDVAGGAIDFVKDIYIEEDGTVDWGKAAKDAALTGLMFTPVGMAARGAQLAGGLGRLLLRSKKAQTAASNLMRKLPQYKKLPKKATLTGAESSRAAAQLLTTPITKFKKSTRLLSSLGLADSALDPRTSQTGEITNEIANQAEAEAANQASAERNRQIALVEGILARQQGSFSGGIVKMQNGSQVPSVRDMTDAELQDFIKEAAFGGDAKAKEYLRTNTSSARPRPVFSDDFLENILGRNADGFLSYPISPYPGGPLPIKNSADSNDDAGVKDGGNDGTGGNDSAGGINFTSPNASTNATLLEMISGSQQALRDLAKREISGPDYAAFQEKVMEGVDDDAAAAALMAIGKSISSGKGIGEADFSDAMAIKEKAKDAVTAIEMAKAKGASEREIKQLENEIAAEAAILGGIPGFQSTTAGLTNLEKFQRLRMLYPEGTKEREELEKRIRRITEASTGDIVAGIINKMEQGVEQYNSSTGETTRFYGLDALSEKDRQILAEARGLGPLDQVMRTMSDNFVGTN